MTMSYHCQKPECKKISDNSVSGLQGKAGDCQGDIHKGIYICVVISSIVHVVSISMFIMLCSGSPHSTNLGILRKPCVFGCLPALQLGSICHFTLHICQLIHTRQKMRETEVLHRYCTDENIEACSQTHHTLSQCILSHPLC